ncbi:unnamed protein product [Nesidiocoris tenuis]|uniref:Kinesin-associated protein 3 n=1 Tax=Nesidiocoris tenuis TaxID=355587 RepID=A0A6H5FWQ6_9HEMI|nr:unnamed protein product [Nesidiocoris tenuis]
MVHSEDAKYIKRRFWCGSIDVHPTEPALILNYEVEATILSESENPVLSDKKLCQKIIRLKALNKNSDCALLAREVVSKCSLIHPSKIGDVEHLIYFLQSRKENAFAGGYADNGMNNFSGSNGYESPQTNSAEGEKANYANLYQYGDLLYEDLPDKIKGSGLIMQLSLDNDNLEELSRSEAVLSALGRVLREDYKKSIDLCTNILTIFHSFSVFTKFHPLILTYKIGSLSISIIEYELQLYTQWKSDLAFPRGRESAPISRLPVPKSARPASTIIPPARTRSSTPSNDHKRLSLIPVNFSLLLNLAENLKVEDKIRKRNIVAMLVQCLDRNSVPLLIVIAKFLTKFSIRAENKDEMVGVYLICTSHYSMCITTSDDPVMIYMKQANLNVIEKLPKLLQLNNFDLEKATLQLLFNLSFDTNLREKMIRVGFLQKLASLLNDERHLSIILKILYHLSLDDRVKAMFTFTNCLPKLMKMLISFDHKNPDFKILVALSVNVALNSRCAETMCENGCLEHLKQRTLAYRDPLLMKVLRNLSTHASTKSDFLYAFLIFAIDYLIDLMNDTNPSIKKVCDACVEIIKEDDSEYEERVKVEKFQAHNSHWIAMVENKALESSLSTLDSDYRDTMPAYDFNQSFLLNAESQMTMSNLDDIEIISNNPQSDEGSRPWSRYDSEGEEFLDSYVTKKNATNEDAVQNALRNLVIADDADDAHQYYHIGTPNTQVSMT